MDWQEIRIINTYYYEDYLYEIGSEVILGPFSFLFLKEDLYYEV